MSGGSFDYHQMWIDEIANTIEHELQKQGEEKPKDELFMGSDYYKEHEEERFYSVYPKEIQDKLKEASLCLRRAYIYADTADRFFAGDCGDKAFLETLKTRLRGLGDTGSGD